MTLVQNPKLFSYFCSLLSRVGIIPIKFHSISRRTELTFKQSAKIRINIRFHTVLVIIVIIQALLKNNKFSLQGVQVWVGVMIQFFAHVFVHEQVKKGQDITNFCNALFQFDEIYGTMQLMENRVPFRIWLIMIMGYSIVISTIAIPLGFVYGLHWMNPCKASLVGYWLLPECYGRMSTFSIKLAMMLLNHWMVSMSIHSAGFLVSVLTTMSVGSIQQFIQRLDLRKS